jgi:hypothetical protein
MAFKTAEEAYQQFLDTGEYMNNDSHFEGTPEERRALFGAYKHMIPQQVKKDFKAKVSGNENRALTGLQEGRSLESQGIFNEKENGQALYRRIHAGLGTGLDLNKAYNFDAGTAREVGTTDMAKWNTTRGITDTERQRHADFSAAGSPEAFWSAYRQQQIGGLLDSGAIAKDDQGYYNPGPGGGDRYGANLEGYNMGRGVMGNGTNLGGPNMGGGGSAPARSYTSGSYQSPVSTLPQPAAPQTPAFSMPSSNTGFTGGMPKMDFSAGQGSGGGVGSNFDLNSLLSGKGKGGAIYAADGYQNPVMPPGPLPDGGTPLVVHPGENVSVTPASQNPANGSRGTGVVREVGPGGSALPNNSPFGTNPVPLPTGNGLVPGGGSSTGSGGSQIPNLPGVNLPGQIPLGNSNPLAAPGGQGLAGQAGYDNRGQQFNYNRAVGEYGGAQALEGGLLGIYGDILGFDPSTGAQRGAADSNNRSFAYLAPQAQRVAGDADALVKRLEATLPPGGQRDAAIAEALRGAQADISGGRQALMQQALTGVSDLAQSKKQFDPQYTGANQSLLDAYGNLRGQDLSTMLGSRGQDITGMLGARGQDVQWGLGQQGLQQQEMQNLWNSYLTGRGQDMDLYSTTRGQDLQQLIARQQAQAQRAAADRGFWGNILGTVGTIAGGLLGGPPGAAIGGGLGSAAGGGGFSLGS